MTHFLIYTLVFFIGWLLGLVSPLFFDWYYRAELDKRTVLPSPQEPPHGTDPLRPQEPSPP